MIIKGEHLRKMRLYSRKTTVQMAEIAGVKTRKTYENWEKDAGSPSINQYIALCLGCDIDPAQALNSKIFDSMPDGNFKKYLIC